ncbi:type II toxin-antitoxin system Phd/YefM family antitoxin [Fusibacter ferrireducens]|uniref:Antitoxin n=1 Tax=Fusibacter ferrireducens TaxID=2785058 RepID=A0ABS0A0A1_9FIRM|nr:type II toxin-antitoxin system Phd/YefM family antitoxin [Fusibacter ferrireducens]MBF4696066.1 type II toxin-antitoxin system Phd/YefM family antitoxin [Fusibacter ferrireducens]
MIAKNLDLRNALDHIISVSDLGRGKASKVIQDVERNKDQYIVVKNNRPQAVILSVDEYNNLMETREELELLLIATKRISENNHDEYTSLKVVMEEIGITDSEIDELVESVDIE